MKQSAIIFVASAAVSAAFVPSPMVQKRSHPFRPPLATRPWHSDGHCTVLMAGNIGIFFGTSTGSTQGVADRIAEEFGPDSAAEPIEIDGIQGSVADKFAQFDALVVGTPTWNTGADTERSGTGWDEIYYGEMKDLNIAEKKVAVFGLGDSVSYSENYADASGELHDVFESLGCKMLGYTSKEGYEHEASKAIRGEQFCGLLLDEVNQEDLTEGRVKKWVEQLIAEGILEGGSAGGGTDAPVAEAVVDVEAVETPATPVELEENSRLLDEALAADDGTYVPHYNPKTGKTMWTSKDGRSCYYT